MKILSKISFLFLFTLLSFSAANAQSEWLGSYEFNEDGGKTAGGTQIFVAHRMDILESDEGLIAMIQSEGFQTSRDLIAIPKAEGGKLRFYFESYGENNIFETYKKGDLLFTLERKSGKQSALILTFWDKFQPVVPKNEESGKIYFQKTPAND